jgi:hypothetical protein
MHLIEFTSKIHASPSVFARVRSFLCVYSSHESDWSDSAAIFMSALRGGIVQAVLMADLPNWPCVFGSVCGVVGIARRTAVPWFLHIVVRVEQSLIVNTGVVISHHNLTRSEMLTETKIRLVFWAMTACSPIGGGCQQFSCHVGTHLLDYKLS